MIFENTFETIISMNTVVCLLKMFQTPTTNALRQNHSIHILVLSQILILIAQKLVRTRPSKTPALVRISVTASAMPFMPHMRAPVLRGIGTPSSSSAF